MFTGIVESLGEVVSVHDGDGLRGLRLDAPRGFVADLRPGASVSIDGACLTPVAVDKAGFTVQAVGTTLARTITGTYREGHRVNLERAVAVGAHLDGHIVQGHIDGIGHLRGIRDGDGFQLMEFSIPEEVAAITLLHGSIALNGVSLTVNRLESDGVVEVAIIPHTWEITNFQYLEIDEPVNVEGDVIGKYVSKLLRDKGDASGGGSGNAL